MDGDGYFGSAFILRRYFPLEWKLYVEMRIIIDKASFLSTFCQSSWGSLLVDLIFFAIVGLFIAQDHCGLACCFGVVVPDWFFSDGIFFAHISFFGWFFLPEVSFFFAEEDAGGVVVEVESWNRRGGTFGVVSTIVGVFGVGLPSKGPLWLVGDGIGGFFGALNEGVAWGLLAGGTVLHSLKKWYYSKLISIIFEHWINLNSL